MKYYPTAMLIVRWGLWLLLVSFESVVGFPWLSMLVAGEWVFRSVPQASIASVLVLSLILAAAYSLVWPVAVLLMIIVWQTAVRTKKNSWQRWAFYAGSAAVVGVVRQLPLNALSIFFTLVSALVLLRFLGVNFLKTTWQKRLKNLPA